MQLALNEVPDCSMSYNNINIIEFNTIESFSINENIINITCATLPSDFNIVNNYKGNTLHVFHTYRTIEDGKDIQIQNLYKIKKTNISFEVTANGKPAVFNIKFKVKPL